MMFLPSRLPLYPHSSCEEAFLLKLRQRALEEGGASNRAFLAMIEEAKEQQRAN
jgi:hypothetical protein